MEEHVNESNRIFVFLCSQDSREGKSRTEKWEIECVSLKSNRNQESKKLSEPTKTSVLISTFWRFTFWRVTCILYDTSCRYCGKVLLFHRYVQDQTITVSKLYSWATVPVSTGIDYTVPATVLWHPVTVLYPTLRTMHLLHTRRHDHPYQDIRDRPCRRDNDIDSCQSTSNINDEHCYWP